MTDPCERCGYDYAGLEVCPECGTTAQEQAALLEGRRVRAILTFLVSIASIWLHIMIAAYSGFAFILGAVGVIAVGLPPFVWMLLIIVNARWTPRAQRLILAGAWATLGLTMLTWFSAFVYVMGSISAWADF